MYYLFQITLIKELNYSVCWLEKVSTLNSDVFCTLDKGNSNTSIVIQNNYTSREIIIVCDMVRMSMDFNKCKEWEKSEPECLKRTDES
jgi:hypothetical protein